VWWLDDFCLFAALHRAHGGKPWAAWLRPLRNRAFRYLGSDLPVPEAIWAFLEKLMVSKTDLVIVPLQDLLALGADSRMNDPGKTFGNWKWRCAGKGLKLINWGRFKSTAASVERC
jgi:4-alpha-glucanotransferase